MICMAIYDVMGIQDFIFRSKKLKENLGASIIVQDTFEKTLTKILDEKFKPSLINWWDLDLFELATNKELIAEVIYIGGGNALVAYQNIDIAKTVTRKLSEQIFLNTGGALRFAVAYFEIEDVKTNNFAADKRTLFRTLKTNKYKLVQSSPLMGIAITREGETDGLPAVKYYPDDEKSTKYSYLSECALQKRETEKSNLAYYNDKLGYTSKVRSFPRNFDYLGQKEGEQNYIAVVHIDGNNMGKNLDKKLSDITDYEQAIKVNRKLSWQIDKIYKQVLRDIVVELEHALDTTPSFTNEFHHENIKKFLPIRPIVLNGDDITFVCQGQLGIPLAELFLKKLNNSKPIKIDNVSLKMSACAGIAIIKPHFPFYRAYLLAEELCKSAKQKAKILASNMNVDVGNWLDFHIVQSGITTDLSTLRAKHYNVPDMEKPAELTDDKNTGMSYQPHNLLWRPWCINQDSCPNILKWDKLLSISQTFKRANNSTSEKKEWKRSRLLKLRNDMIESEEKAQNRKQLNESRGYKLPTFLGNSDVFKENNKKIEIHNQSPYFDAIEMMDFYLDIPQRNGGAK